MAAGRVLPASRTHSVISSARCVSNASAARFSAAARSVAGVASQAGNAAVARTSEARASSAPASTTWPTTSLCSAGLVRLVSRPVTRLPATDGRAANCSLNAGAVAFRNSLMTSASARFSPVELRRCAPNSPGGSGIFGCGMRLQRIHHRDRITDDLGHRQAFIDDAIDEGGVRAVFQQPAHQVGQQLFMRAHRRVHAAWQRSPRDARTTLS